MDTALTIIQAITQSWVWLLFPLLFYVLIGAMDLFDSEGIKPKIEGVLLLFAVLTIVGSALYAEDRQGWFGIDGGPRWQLAVILTGVVVAVTIVNLLLMVRSLGIFYVTFMWGLALVPINYALLHTSEKALPVIVLMAPELLLGGIALVILSLRRNRGSAEEPQELAMDRKG